MALPASCLHVSPVTASDTHLVASPKGPTGDEESSASDVAFCRSESRFFDSSLSKPVSLPAV